MNTIIKRFLDVFLSLIALFFLSPLWMSLYVYMAIIYGIPVFFVHTRVGKNGKMFKCVKFRTMVLNAEEMLNKWLSENPKIREEFYKDFKLKNDPRIAGNMGKILRETSLDELPQIYNIIRGEMSIVGPRPIVSQEIEKYGIYFEEFAKVRPGLTGLWQVSGRNDINYDDRVALDVYYVENNNVFMDIAIIVKTLRVIIFKSGAY